MRIPSRPRRAGNVMLLCALLLFAIFGVAALTIDMGLVMMTRRQMQTAVDSAAREGLRFRDSSSESARRTAANEMVQANMGSTSIFTFTGGIALPGTTFMAAQTISIGSFTVDLALNDRTNDPSGDLVAGTFAMTNLTGAIPADATTINVASGAGFAPFDGNASVRISVGNEVMQLTDGFGKTTWTVQRGVSGTAAQAHPQGSLVRVADRPIEQISQATNQYERNDFTAAPAGTASDSFLVRVRRTNDVLDPTIGTTGPTVPIVFGRGSLLALDTKAKGVSVRATAIAQAQPTMSVGAVHLDATPPLPGATPFVLFLAKWSDVTVFAPNTPVSLTMNGSGQLNAMTSAGTVAVGYFFRDTPQSATLGQNITQLPSDPLLAPLLASTGYVPIIPKDASPLDQTITGFGLLAIDTASITPKGFSVTKLPSKIASENATSILTQQLPAIFSDPVSGPANISLLFSNLRSLPEPLLSPALVR